MKKKLFFCIGLLTLSMPVFSQVKVGKTVMDYEVEVYDQTLIMNGSYERSKYSMALYLKSISKDGLGVCFADQTMSLVTVFTSNGINKETFVESLEEDFDKITDGNPGPLQGHIDKAIGFFKEPIVKNDVIEFVYESGVGTHFIKNNKELGVVEGQDFKYALYKIWLGEDAISDDLRSSLLGSK